MFKSRIFINQEKIKAIFFDFDGVIVDSVDVKTKAFRELFKDHPSDIQQKVVDYHLAHGGVSRFEKIRYYYSELLQQPITESEVQALCARFSDLVIDKVVNAEYIPGSLEFLENNYCSFTCFVISGTPESELIEIVQRRGIAKYFKETLGSPIKKAEHIRYLLDKYALNRDEVLFVGDSQTDFSAALAQKILFVSV